MKNRSRVAVLALLSASFAACGPGKLTESAALRLVEEHAASVSAPAELLVTADELTLCPLFFRYEGRVVPKARCNELGSLAGTNDGRLVVTRPEALKRRIIRVKSVSSNEKSTERTAVVEWEWVYDPLSTELASCFDRSPREALVIFEARGRSWAVKDILIEKLGVLSARCGA